MIKAKTKHQSVDITWTLKDNGTSILEFDPCMKLDKEETWQFLNKWRREEEDAANERLLLGSVFK